MRHTHKETLRDIRRHIHNKGDTYIIQETLKYRRRHLKT